VIPEVDGLRFIAIMWVLLFHVYGSVPGRPGTDAESTAQAYLLQVLSVGFFGVQIFFFISSFMLAIPFAESHLLDKKGVRLSSYYIRRLTRMYPPYVIHLVVLTGFVLALGRTGLIWDSCFAARSDFTMFVVRHNLAGALCVHNAAAGYANPLNCPLWTIEALAQFYVVLPLLAAIYRIRPTAVRRLILISIAGGGG
jgi:peptidoglycan/LPS O-acetylase OafA/YrhL